MSNVAQSVIAKFGGVPALATILGVHPSRIYRWTYPKNRGGTGGSIPYKRQIQIMKIAPKHGVSVNPADFFPNAGCQ